MSVDEAKIIFDITDLDNQIEEKVVEIQEIIRKKRSLLNDLKNDEVRIELLSKMSHGFRTPLNSIIGFTDLLLEGCYGILDEKPREILNDIKESADQLHQLVLDAIENHQEKFEKYRDYKTTK